MARLGLWIDDPVRVVRTEKFWDELAAHGVSTAALMLEPLAGGFDPRLGVAALEQIGALARKRDVEVVLTIWPEPRRAYLAELERGIGACLDAAGAAALEVDTESNWMPSAVHGFPSLAAASVELVRVLKSARKRHDVRLELTTFPMHRENGPKAMVGPSVDRLLPQAYSVRRRSDGLVKWDAPFGPGKMQRLTLDKARTVPRVKKVSCGLAAYDQDWPDHTPADAMQAAWDAALAYGPEEIRFWSSKWVLGSQKNGYASRFLKAIADGR